MKRKYIPIAVLPQEGDPTIERVMEVMVEYNMPAVCLVGSNPAKEHWVVLVHRYDHADALLLLETLRGEHLAYEVEFPERDSLGELRKYMTAEDIAVAVGEGYISLRGDALCVAAAGVLNSMAVPCNLPDRTQGAKGTGGTKL